MTTLNLPFSISSRLSTAAAAAGVSEEAFALAALEQGLDYDAWFKTEVQKGIAAADRGELEDASVWRAEHEARLARLTQLARADLQSIEN